MPVDTSEERTELESRVQAFGTSVRVRTPCAPGTPELFDELLSAWRDSGVPNARTESEPDETPLVEVPQLSRGSLEFLAYRFSVHVTTAALEYHRGRQLMFHAGGIARSDGAVVAIVGPSGRGKTTTIRELAREYGYVSDETIAITGQGEVWPYRKPLSVITEGHQDKVQIPPSDLHLQPLPDGVLRIAGLVLLDRAAEEIRTSQVESVSLAEGLVELVQQTSYLVELPHPLRRIAEIATATGGVRRLLAAAPESISAVADSLFEPSQCEPWQQVMPSVVPALPYRVSDDVVDAVECTDGTVVMTRDRQVRLLQGVGSLIWSSLCEGDDWDALELRAHALLGPPPAGTAIEAITAACDELTDTGIIVAR